MMWQLKPCMSQEFPPILQSFHCPVSLSPLHAVILLLCVCAHRWSGSDPGQSTEVSVERCVSQPHSELRCEFVVVWIFEMDLDDCASVQTAVFCPRSSSRGVAHLRRVLNAWKDVPVSWSGSSQTADCCLCVGAAAFMSQPDKCHNIVLSSCLLMSLSSYSNRTIKMSFCLRLWGRNLQSSYILQVSTDGFVQTSFTTWFIEHFIPEKLENLFCMAFWQYFWIYGVKKRDFCQNSVSKNFWLWHVNKTAPSISTSKAGWLCRYVQMQRWNPDPPAQELIRVRRVQRHHVRLKTKE